MHLINSKGKAPACTAEWPQQIAKANCLTSSLACYRIRQGGSGPDRKNKKGDKNEEGTDAEDSDNRKRAKR
jgi:hypothetical protein